jgi:two-component system chemotaxis response regulator CheB
VDARHFLIKLQKSTRLPCHIADDNMPLKKGQVYMAPANIHMIVKEEAVILGRGPAESKWRPSVDVTFRSAAVAWDTRSIGIVLSGLLNDGVAGMDAIHRCGGCTIVQDPGEAEYPDMPRAVQKEIPDTRSMPIDAMAAALNGMTDRPPPRKTPPPDVQEEARLAQQVATRIDHMEAQDHPHTLYTCPDCGGGLWEIQEGNITRYRCHIGHTFTEDELVTGQKENIEDTLWIALRIMEERRYLLATIAGREQSRGSGQLGRQYQQKAEEVDLHIERLKEFIFAGQKTDVNGRTDKD